MQLKIVFLAIILPVGVKAIDLNSIFGRKICYDDTQDNCNERFVDVYPHLSKSVTNLTVADTFMLLYTRRSEKPEILHKCGGRLPPDTNFDPKKEVIVISVPFAVGFCDVAVFREFVIQLLKKDDYNIIINDYGWGDQLDYATAVLNIQRIVRYQIFILLKNIQEQIGTPFARLTLIGHSLGGQMSGLIGALIPVDRIIALDPAGPAFDQHKTPLVDRLDPSDAKLVEVWHTNAGDCLPFLGVNYEAGHVNFYINGGSIQKECYPDAFTALLKGDFIYGVASLLEPTICYHTQCFNYFKVTINPEDCQFVGIRCNSTTDYKLGKCKSCGANGENCLIMGFDTEKYIQEIPSTPQIYFVETSSICPYCDNKHVEIDGYKDTYESSLQLSSTKDEADGVLK